MKNNTITLLLALALCASAQAANDFSGEPNCLLHWTFDAIGGSAPVQHRQVLIQRAPFGRAHFGRVLAQSGQPIQRSTAKITAHPIRTAITMRTRRREGGWRAHFAIRNS